MPSPAWAFVVPALAVICVFFLVPVAVAVALSATDFDIYALADLANLRIVGVRDTPYFLQEVLVRNNVACVLSEHLQEAVFLR